MNRTSYLFERARGRRVIDLGFVGGDQASAEHERDALLHAQLRKAARELVGIDFDGDGVRKARELGFEAWQADCEDAESLTSLHLEPAELVVAGELIEHLERPGLFLEAVKVLVAPGGRLVITTPNALALASSSLLATLGREVQNANHVGWQSPRTVERLLSRHGWSVEGSAFCPHPRYRPQPGASLRRRARIVGFNAYQVAAWPLFRLSPGLADGLVVEASLSEGTPAG